TTFHQRARMVARSPDGQHQSARTLCAAARAVVAAMRFTASLPQRGLFEAWRRAARVAISHRIRPEEIDWSGGGGLFGGGALPDEAGSHEARVPAAFLKLAGSVI